jgi:hypothetical protein
MKFKYLVLILAALSASSVMASNCTFSVNSVAATTSPAAASTTSVTLGLNAASETPPGAAVVITCNDINGYVLTALSANNGSLKSGTSALAYKVDVDSGTPVALTTTASNLISKSSLATPENALSHPLRVTYTAGVPNVVSGTYSDVITLTLTGN